ncbi:unnamed protein product [Amoebophrya sp. A25]|nr:unnamed protein product [Amoebophrya sp. A25]|eukprot:GSA25T00009688001.1
MTQDHSALSATAAPVQLTKAGSCGPLVKLSLTADGRDELWDLLPQLLEEKESVNVWKILRNLLADVDESELERPRRIWLYCKEIVEANANTASGSSSRSLLTRRTRDADISQPDKDKQDELFAARRVLLTFATNLFVKAPRLRGEIKSVYFGTEGGKDQHQHQDEEHKPSDTSLFRQSLLSCGVSHPNAFFAWASLIGEEDPVLLFRDVLLRQRIDIGIGFGDDCEYVADYFAENPEVLLKMLTIIGGVGIGEGDEYEVVVPAKVASESDESDAEDLIRHVVLLTLRSSEVTQEDQRVFTFGDAILETKRFLWQILVIDPQPFIGLLKSQFFRVLYGEYFPDVVFASSVKRTGVKNEGTIVASSIPTNHVHFEALDFLCAVLAYQVTSIAKPVRERLFAAVLKVLRELLEIRDRDLHETLEQGQVQSNITQEQGSESQRQALEHVEVEDEDHPAIMSKEEVAASLNDVVRKKDRKYYPEFVKRAQELRLPVLIRLAGLLLLEPADAQDAEEETHSRCSSNYPDGVDPQTRIHNIQEVVDTATCAEICAPRPRVSDDEAVLKGRSDVSDADLTLLLNFCYSDHNLPTLKETAVFAVRNAAHGNPGNQERIRKLLATTSDSGNAGEIYSSGPQ